MELKRAHALPLSCLGFGAVAPLAYILFRRSNRDPVFMGLFFLVSVIGIVATTVIAIIYLQGTIGRLRSAVLAMLFVNAVMGLIVVFGDPSD